MRRLIASTFVSLDGIMQAPGAPKEDPAARTLNERVLPTHQSRQ